ncbi:MAG TPA: hypothetical protein VJB66_04060 [Candidatus Nanoarchaeia archaeon]|nr:hypothetical protein [Candidatus Nanoarchaeia archaeon]
MKKSGLVIISLFFILLFAGSVLAESMFESSGNIIQRVIKVIAGIFTVDNWFASSLDAGTLYLGFLRFCVWAITFAVFYYALSKAEMKRVGSVISFFLALIAAIFIPGSLLLLIGNVYGTVAVFGLIFGAIYAIGTLIYSIDGSTKQGRIGRFMLLFFLLFILWIVWDGTESLGKEDLRADTTGQVAYDFKYASAAGGRALQIDKTVIEGMNTATGIAFMFVMFWTIFEFIRIFMDGAAGTHTTHGATPAHTTTAHTPGALPPGVYGPPAPGTPPPGAAPAAATAATTTATTLDAILQRIRDLIRTL